MSGMTEVPGYGVEAKKSPEAPVNLGKVFRWCGNGD